MIVSREYVTECGEDYEVQTFSTGRVYWIKRGSLDHHRLGGPASYGGNGMGEHYFIAGRRVYCAREHDPAFKAAVLRYLQEHQP